MYDPNNLTRLANVPSRSHGFTLIELIMVVVILGVLAVVAAPRILNTGDFAARGFHDETLSILRYAQKTAIAQRRMVCVIGTANSVTLTFFDSTSAVPLVNGCNEPLTGPTGKRPADILAKSGVTYFTSAPGAVPSIAAPSFNFDGLGQPVDGSGAALAANQVIQVNNASNTITVEAATGYVHE